MSTSHQSIPLPLPHKGVLTSISSRYIGSDGLADALNIVIRNGRLIVRSGLEQLNSASIEQRPMGIHSFAKASDDIITVIGTDDGWHVLNSNFTTTDITDDDDPLTASDTTQQVVFRTFDAADPESTGSGSSRFVIGVNGKDSAKVWNGTNLTYSAIENEHDTQQNMFAKCVATSFDRVVFGNITIDGDAYPDAIIYTDSLKYDHWRRTHIIRAASTPGEIISMMEMGNMAVAIYKADSIYMLSAIGQVNAPFRLDLRVANTIGPASPLSVVPIDNAVHAYLASNGDVVIFDGSRAVSMGEHIQSYMQLTADYEKLSSSFGIYDNYRKELYFFYVPYGGNDVSSCIMISLANPASPTLWPIKYGVDISAASVLLINKTKTIDELGSISIDSLSGTIDGYGSFSPYMVLGTPYRSPDGGTPSGGLVYSSNGYDDAGTAIDWHMRTGWYDLGEFTTYKTIHEVNHLFNGDEGEEITVQTSISEFGEEYEASSGETITIGETPYVTYHRDDARLMAFIFSGHSTSRLEWLGSEAFVSARNRR